MKKLLIIPAFFISMSGFGQAALGEIIGEVVDAETEAAIYGAHIFVIDNDRKYQAYTEPDGRFRISAIPAGTYIINVRYRGDTLTGLRAEVPMDGFYNAGVIRFSGEKNDSIKNLTSVRVSAHGTIRLIDGNLPVTSITAKEIDKSPAKFDVKSLVSSMTSEVRMTEDGELVFRGARKGDMIYLIDGVKTRDAGSIPGVAIGRMSVYTGGLPAKYGDTLGGVVVMETKSYFDLLRSWEAQNLK